MKNILVLGGAGFIGSNFIKELSSNNSYNIINIDKLSYSSNINFLKNINKNYFFYKVSIGNKKKIELILKKHKPFRIINFAANTHVDRSIENSKNFIKDNIVELNNFLDVLKDYYFKNKTNFKFHQVSTDEVYGDIDLQSQKKFNENQKYNPSNPYSASKASSDHIVNAWSRTYNIPISISLCSNNYGENQHLEKFIPKTIVNFLMNKPIEIYGNGQNIRNWIYVKDHCYILKKILFSNITGHFNISSNRSFSNFEIAKKIFYELKKNNNKLTKFSLFYKFVKDRPGHDKKYSINSLKVRKKFNWKEKYNFEKNIKKTIIWYMKNINYKNIKKTNLRRMGIFE